MKTPLTPLTLLTPPTPLTLLISLLLLLVLPRAPLPAPAPDAAGIGPAGAVRSAAPAPLPSLAPSPVPRGGPGPVRPLPAPLVVVRWWEPPPTPYAAGHRGVDLSAPAGAELRAVAAGRVHYAGPVAGRGVLSIALAEGLRTTYEPVRPLVAEGEAVTAGQVVAVLTEGSHCPGPCLHWGLLSGDTYLNPLALTPRPSPRLLPMT